MRANNKKWRIYHNKSMISFRTFGNELSRTQRRMYKAKNESPWSSAREHCCKWRRTVRGNRARKAIVDCDLFPPLFLTSSRGTASSDTGEWEDCLRRWLKVVDFSSKLTVYMRVCVYACICARVCNSVYRWGNVTLPFRKWWWIYLGFSPLRYRFFTRNPRTSLLSMKKPMRQDYSTKLERMSFCGWNGRSII